MSLRAYTLKDPYVGKLVGASCPAGPDGQSMDIMQALQDGNGAITTEDNVIQSVLENIYGGHGLLFDVHDVDPETGAHSLIVKQEPGPPAPHLMEGAAATGTADLPDAVHADSGYAGMPLEELKQTATERGLKIKASAIEQDVIDALEKSDQEGIPNNGS